MDRLGFVRGWVVVGLLATSAVAADPPEWPSSVPFDRHTTTDRYGRTVTFYLSKPTGKDAAPLVLVVPGSGGQSVWSKLPDGKIGGGLHMLARKEFGAGGRVLAVEKPGVDCFFQPQRVGSAVGTPTVFRTEHTLERWTEANRAALRAAWKLPGVDPFRTLAAGHSEGGIVAARVAAEEPTVTHVGVLAGGGPTQLFDLVELAAERAEKDKPGTGPAARDAVLAQWAAVRADPDSADKLWLGHPHRRWTSFLATGPTDLLLKSSARVYLAQGTADAAVHVGSFDLCRAELAARGRDVTADRVAGADHGFRMPGDDKGDGLAGQFRKLAAWFRGPNSP